MTYSQLTNAIRRAAKCHSHVAVLSLSLCAQAAHAAEEYVSAQQMKYKESDGRMDIDYRSVHLVKELGTDFSLSVGATQDIMSGATPVWDLASGASQYSDVDDQGLIGEELTQVSDFKYAQAHMDDERYAADGSVTWRTPESRDELTVGVSWSKEEDYNSVGGSIQYLHYLVPSKNRSLTVGMSVLDNDVEFRREKKWKDARFYTAQVGLTEIISKTLLAKLSVFFMYDKGALSNPYQTVLRAVNKGTDDAPLFRLYLGTERRPDERRMAGVHVSFSKRLNEWYEHLTVRGVYRLINDDWGVINQTLENGWYVGELDRYGMVSFNMRFYHQTKASFYKSHESEDNYFAQFDYASNDARLGDLSTMTASLGYDIRLFDHWQINTLAGYQDQSIGLRLTWVSLGVRYDF